jgi:ketosteroid isomerase-like protein
MLILLAAVAAAAATPPAADASTVAAITALETRWGEAFVKRDFGFIESIIAPEYALSGTTPAGDIAMMRRDPWMKNARLWVHEGFDARVVDVATAGDTAVATVEGLWTVKRDPNQPADRVRFVVTDTWVRRHGQWQVVWRYSNRLNAPWPRPTVAATAAAKP